MDIDEIERRIAELEAVRDRGTGEERIAVRDELFGLREQRRQLRSPSGSATSGGDRPFWSWPLSWNLAELDARVGDLQRWHERMQAEASKIPNSALRESAFGRAFREWERALDELVRDPEHPHHGVDRLEEIADANGLALKAIMRSAADGLFAVFAPITTDFFYNGRHQGSDPGPDDMCAPSGFGLVTAEGLRRLLDAHDVSVLELVTRFGYATQMVKPTDLFARRKAPPCALGSGYADAGLKVPTGELSDSDPVLMPSDPPTPRQWKHNITTLHRVIRGLIASIQANEPGLSLEQIATRVNTATSHGGSAKALAKKLGDIINGS